MEGEIRVFSGRIDDDGPLLAVVRVPLTGAGTAREGEIRLNVPTGSVVVHADGSVTTVKGGEVTWERTV